MSGISATQATTVINAGGTASFAAPQPGTVTGALMTLALVGTTHSSLSWSMAGPAGTGESLSSDTATEPTFTPDISGVWLISLDGLDSGGAVEASYILPLLITRAETAYYTGPLSLAYLAATNVGTPSIGQVLYQNWSKGGAITAKDASATSRQVIVARSGATGSRPATTNLDIGTPYFDTTLGYQVIWSGTNWVNHAGATV